MVVGAAETACPRADPALGNGHTGTCVEPHRRCAAHRCDLRLPCGGSTAIALYARDYPTVPRRHRRVAGHGFQGGPAGGSRSTSRCGHGKVVGPARDRSCPPPTWRVRPWPWWWRYLEAGGSVDEQGLRRGGGCGAADVDVHRGPSAARISARKFAAFWLLVASALLILSLLPGILRWAAQVAGVEVPANLLFLLAAVLLLLVRGPTQLRSGTAGPALTAAGRGGRAPRAEVDEIQGRTDRDR